MAEPHDPELGRLQFQLTVGSDDQRTLAWVRGIAAFLSLGCAGLLLLAKVPIPVFLAAVLGVLMSLVWLGQARRAAGTARDAQAHYLAVYEHGFIVAEAQKVTRVPFAQVRTIEEDFERVDVAVTMREGSTLRVEPRYPGLAIHQLVHKLHSAAEASWQAQAREQGREPPG